MKLIILKKPAGYTQGDEQDALHAVKQIKIKYDTPGDLLKPNSSARLIDPAKDSTEKLASDDFIAISVDDELKYFGSVILINKEHKNISDLQFTNKLKGLIIGKPMDKNQNPLPPENVNFIMRPYLINFPPEEFQRFKNIFPNKKFDYFTMKDGDNITGRDANITLSVDLTDSSKDNQATHLLMMIGCPYHDAASLDNALTNAEKIIGEIKEKLPRHKYSYLIRVIPIPSTGTFAHTEKTIAFTRKHNVEFCSRLLEADLPSMARHFSGSFHYPVRQLNHAQSIARYLLNTLNEETNRPRFIRFFDDFFGTKHAKIEALKKLLDPNIKSFDELVRIATELKEDKNVMHTTRPLISRTAMLLDLITEHSMHLIHPGSGQAAADDYEQELTEKPRKAGIEHVLKQISGAMTEDAEHADNRGNKPNR